MASTTTVNISSKISDDVCCRVVGEEEAEVKKVFQEISKKKKIICDVNIGENSESNKKNKKDGLCGEQC